MSENANHLLLDANHIASRSASAVLNLSHLLCAMYMRTHGFSSFILKEHFRRKFKGEIKLQQLKKELHLPNMQGEPLDINSVVLSDPVKWVIGEAKIVAKGLDQNTVGSAEILIALLKLFDKKVDDIRKEVQGKDEIRKFFYHQAEKQYIQAGYIDEIEILRPFLEGISQEEVKNELMGIYRGYRFHKAR